MNESFPQNFERRVDRNEVIEALRSKADTSKEVLKHWVSQQENEIDEQFPNEKYLERSVAQFTYQVDLVKIYYAAGLVDEAVESLNSTVEGMKDAVFANPLLADLFKQSGLMDTIEEIRRLNEN